MAAFNVDEIGRVTGGSIANRAGSDFTGVATDSRTIRAGNLFVAIAGERFDGHNFIEQAVLNGAAGVLISRTGLNSPANVSVIAVPDTLKAYQAIAAWHRAKFTIPLVAVTGSNGKTTTKDFTAAVLASRFSVLKTQANYNNEIGLPFTLLQLASGHQAAVVEMGMRGLGEIRELAFLARPTIGIVTNVGETHLELLGSLDNIAAAKAELVEAIPADGVVILNADNDYVRAMQSKSAARVVFYGIQHPCQVRAANIISKGGGTVFDCVCAQTGFTVEIPAVGRHNVYNALAAIAAGLELGLSTAEIKAGLTLFTPGAMRLSMEKLGKYHIINDAYNASPMSMAAAIDTLKEVAPGRRIAVLGDMLELGAIAVDAHCEAGRKLAESGVDIVVTIGPLAAHIAQTARLHGVAAARVCDSHQQAAEYLRAILKPEDTILLKGSRGMKMEKILEKLS